MNNTKPGTTPTPEEITPIGYLISITGERIASVMSAATAIRLLFPSEVAISATTKLEGDMSLSLTISSLNEDEVFSPCICSSL